MKSEQEIQKQIDYNEKMLSEHRAKLKDAEENGLFSDTRKEHIAIISLLSENLSLYWVLL